MEEVSRRPDIPTQTCTVRTREGRLPDLAALKQTVESLGIGARLRGVEAHVEGRLAWTNGEPVLRVAGSKEDLRLGTYAHAVQWNFGKKRARRIRDEERKAYSTLVRSAKTAARPVLIIGPLRPDERGSGLVVEVRSFKWLAP